MSNKTYTVTCFWDDEVAMWYVAETVVPGLATEAATLEEIEHKLLRMITELLALNDSTSPLESVPFELIARKRVLAASI